MLKIIHRINKIEDLKKIPHEYGVEIDVRADGKRLILNHEPHHDGDNLEDYLKEYNHKFIIFNIKTAGIEEEVIDLAKKYNIDDYFLLDVEYPFIYKATHKLGFKKIAIRYSEAEPIEMAEAHRGLLDWVWIDTNSTLPLDEKTYKRLHGFKLCLVCPERWGRPQDIKKYKEYMKQHNIKMDAVMTAFKYVGEWE